MDRVSQTNKQLRSSIDVDDNEEEILSTNDDNDDDDTSSNGDISLDENIIYPGLVLHWRYLLLRKIGAGSNASVWLIYDAITKTYCAMKIQDNECYQDGCREVAIIRQINKFAKDNPQRKTFCVQMLDFFTYQEDDDTKFVCSVYPLYAGSVQMLLNDGKYKYGLPINVVKQIAIQVLKGLIVLHENLSIIHTDIKPENILFKGVTPDYLTVIELLEKSKFQEKFDILVNRYGIKLTKNNTIPESNSGKARKNNSESTFQCAIIDPPDQFTDDLEILGLESIKEINYLDNNFETEEEFQPDESDELISEDEEECTDEDSTESSDSVIEDEMEGNKINLNRTQSVDDLLEFMDCKEIYDMDKITKLNELDKQVKLYDFEIVRNNRSKTSDPKTIISDDHVTTCRIDITDFGNSYFFSKKSKNEIQARYYRAPEIILDSKYGYGYACDIWSFGCVIFELLTGFPLFEPQSEPLNRDIHHLYLFEKLLGPIPIKIKKISKRKRFLFDTNKNYHIKNIEPFTNIPLKKCLVDQYLFSEQEATEINDFIRSALNYDPSERPTARDMLQHKWLQTVTC